MQEFSTVIASSYDAESLAPMLTEKAADGWSVVSIVSAGTNVIAYLTRGGGTPAPSADAPAAIVGVADVPTEVADTASDEGVPVAADGGAVDDATMTTPQPMPSTDFSDDAGTTPEPDADQGGWGSDSATTDAPAMANDAAAATNDDQFTDGMGAVAGGAGLAADTGDIGGAALSSTDVTDSGSGTDATDSGDATAALSGGITGEADPTPTNDAPAEGSTDQAPAPADDAVAPIDDSTDATVESVESAADHAGAVASTTTDGDTDAATSTATSTEDAATEPAATETAAPADASGVPAGWYADPSGRYELRYWDGAAWTEHVSRAGQQYTDPPVA